MPTLQEYRYQAVNVHDGGQVKGSLEALSENAVISKLRAQGLTPLEVVPANKTGLNREIEIPGFGNKRVKLKSLAVFARQLATLIQSGLPLMRAIVIVSEQTQDKALQRALESVVSDIENGLSFSDALKKQPDVFPPMMVSLIKVGETGGFLDRSMEQVATTYQDEVELRGKIKSATTYPMIVAGIAVAAVIGMVTFIVPIFEDMFSSLGGDLPLPTQILVTISHNMKWLLPLMIVLAIGFVLWWRAHKNDPKVRAKVDPWKLRVPVFGPLNRKVALARFARNLAMMVGAGVPLLQALTLVGMSANNWEVERAVDDIHESMRTGKSFAAPLSEHDVFPPMVAQMVSVGEESGALAEMLGSIADFYDKEVETATEQLASSIEPLMIVFLGVVIGGMVISLYMPMFSIYGELNKQ